MAYTIEYEGFQQYNGNTTNGVGLSSRWVLTGSTAETYLRLDWQGSLFRNLNIRYGPSGSSNLARLISANPSSEGAVGFRFLIYGSIGDNEGNTIVRLSPEGTTAPSVSLTVRSDSMLVLTVGGVTHETAGRIFQDEWHFFEWEWKTGPAGFFKMYQNGELIFEQAGFLASDTTRIASFICWSTYQNCRYRVADIYMKMGETGRLGDCRVYYAPVNADDTVEWTPSAGSDNYAMVDELPIDADTTYNSSDVLNSQDTFTVTPLSFVPERIFAVGILGVGKKSDVADRAVEFFLTANGQDAIRKEKYLATSYTQSYGFATKNPDTNAEFVPEDWDTLRVGYKLTV